MAGKKKKRFVAHDNLLASVIERQAGSLWKAQLEAVMNGIDAGATEVRITLDQSNMTIYDNGKGFSSEAEVDEVFSVFGQPHDLDENGISRDATFGTFRMGRGQLMAFGVNRWVSNRSVMDVDIRKHGLDYSYSEQKTNNPGCHISVVLYHLLSVSAIESEKRQLAHAVKYSPIPVYFNEERLDKDVKLVDWTEESEFAYFLESRSSWDGVHVYHHGIHVETIPRHQYGIGGDLCLRKAVKVNMARNMVIRDCPVFQKACELLKQKGQDKVRKNFRRNLSGAERQAVISDLLESPGMVDDADKLKMFPDITGNCYSWQRLKQVTSQHAKSRKFDLRPSGHCAVSFSAMHNSRADRLMQEQRALVLDEELLENFGVSGEQFVETVTRLMGTPANMIYVPLDELKKQVNSDWTVVQKPTAKEQAILLSMGHVQRALLRDDMEERRLAIGISPEALAFTDGLLYIAYDRMALKSGNPLTEEFWHAWANITLHELCHDEASDHESHIHTPEFYRAFHDRSLKAHSFAGYRNTCRVWLRDRIAHAASVGCKHYLNRMSKKGADAMDAAHRQKLQEARIAQEQMATPDELEELEDCGASLG